MRKGQHVSESTKQRMREARLEYIRNNPVDAHTIVLNAGKRVHKLHPTMNTDMHNRLKLEDPEGYYKQLSEMGKISKHTRNWRPGHDAVEKVRTENPHLYHQRAVERGKASVRSQSKHPNGPETQFIKFNERHNLPYKYCGDGSVWIGNKNPDFIDADGKKEVLDIFGVHWHKPEEVEPRRKQFAQYGFTWRMLWDTDLELPDEEILKKLNIEGIKVPKFVTLKDFY